MELKDVMKILKEDMGVAIFSSVDENNQPHARPINVGVANDDGVFFMTNPKTDFYGQLENNQKVAITGLKNDGKLIQVIRVTGTVRPLEKEMLEEILADNPYVAQVYPDKADQAAAQAFQLYEGDVFYQSLTEGKKASFKIG